MRSETSRFVGNIVSPIFSIPFHQLHSTRMTRLPPLANAQDLNIPQRVTRILRSTSQLQKEVIPTSEDQDMDEIVLAPLPSGTSTSQSQDQLVSSQSRDQDGAGGGRQDANKLSRVAAGKKRAEFEEGDETMVQAGGDEKSMQQALEPPLEDEDETFYDDEEEEEEAEEEEEEEEDQDDLNSDVSEQSQPRSDGETRQIENEMEQLEQNVPQIVEKYKLVDRLGEGVSYSAV
jgi:hypothetical protein